MTDRELLDHFSDVLISDPRLLSLQERELLSNLLQHTLHTDGDSAVTESIARAVGETVAERMHEALGTSILQRLAAERLRSTSNSTGFAPRPPSPGPPSPGISRDLADTSARSFAPRPPSPGPPSPGVSRDVADTPARSFAPRPPSPGPPSPGVSRDLADRARSFAPRPPSPGPPSPGASRDLVDTSARSFAPRPPSPGPPSPGASRDLVDTSAQSFAPRPPSPGPPSPGASRDLVDTPARSFAPRPPSPGPPSPGISFATATASATDTDSVSVAEHAEILPAQCVILEEFLPPQELENLIQDTLRRESEFHLSEVVSPGVNGGAIDFEHRRSRVLLDIGTYGAALAATVKACLPRILPRLGYELFPISRLETQITASNDGDFFRWHNDNAHEEVASREMTFVYFFHREPKKFRGGELRIYDSRWQDGYVPTENYRNIVPRQNQLVVFPSCLAHEITLVDCPSRAFADSRFTVNGWFHR
jgi:SM-20-related protein